MPSDSPSKPAPTEVPLSRLLLSRMQRMAEATTSDYTADEYKAVIADALDLIADTRTQLIGIKDTVHQAHVQFKEMRERVEELEMALKKRALEGLSLSGEYEELSELLVRALPHVTDSIGANAPELAVAIRTKLGLKS